MPDRTLNWGDPADSGTKYRTQDDDPAGGGNFVVAEDLDGNTVLLQYNPTASQWEYGGPVDMDGNDLSNAGTVSATALEANTLTIGGTLYEEDPNSPISVSAVTETAFNPANDYDDIIIIPDHNDVGFDQLQVNGDTGSNYDYLDNSDTQTTGATEFTIPRQIRVAYYQVFAERTNAIVLSVNGIGENPGATVSGRNAVVNGPISELKFIDSGASNRSFNARVYGRSMDI